MNALVLCDSFGKISILRNPKKSFFHLTDVIIDPTGTQCFDVTLSFLTLADITEIRFDLHLNCTAVNCLALGMGDINNSKPAYECGLLK